MPGYDYRSKLVNPVRVQPAPSRFERLVSTLSGGVLNIGAGLLGFCIALLIAAAVLWLLWHL